MSDLASDIASVRATLMVERCTWHDPHSCSMMSHDPDEVTEVEKAFERLVEAIGQKVTA